MIHSYENAALNSNTHQNWHVFLWTTIICTVFCCFFFLPLTIPANIFVLMERLLSGRRDDGWFVCIWPVILFSFCSRVRAAGREFYFTGSWASLFMVFCVVLLKVTHPTHVSAAYGQSRSYVFNAECVKHVQMSPPPPVGHFSRMYMSSKAKLHCVFKRHSNGNVFIIWYFVWTASGVKFTVIEAATK